MNDSQRFHYKDLIHFFPVIVVIILVFFHYDPKISSITSFVNFYSEKIMLRSIIGILFLFYLWIYSFITLIMLVKYQKTKRNFYSFDSKKINLFWLIFVVVSFFFIYNFNIFISAKNMAKPLDEEVEIFRSGALLVYVYFINICGLKQRQLDINEPSVSIKHPITTKKDTSSKYSKSSLNDQLASTYTDKLIKFMNTSKAWKDSELSVAKLSEETEIPKHHITQVLNEHLNKNFYTFVNEYRTEYAMKLIQSPEYKNWSFLAIAYESGFNSKTAFNSFFKKYTNNTPSDFKAHKTISKQNKSKN
jgi:AraC-like DNA-binding protein